MRLRSVLGLCCGVFLCAPWPALALEGMREMAGLGCSTRLPAPRPRVVAAFLAAAEREADTLRERFDPLEPLLFFLLLLDDADFLLLLPLRGEAAAAEVDDFFLLLLAEVFARFGLRLLALGERPRLLLLLLMLLRLLLLPLGLLDALRGERDELLALLVRDLLRPRFWPLLRWLGSEGPTLYTSACVRLRLEERVAPDAADEDMVKRRR